VFRVSDQILELLVWPWNALWSCVLCVSATMGTGIFAPWWV